jgi:hypothetical protein
LRHRARRRGDAQKKKTREKHCISGATVAVGLCNGTTKAINLKLIAVIFGGWIITCPAAGLLTGLLFLGVASAPRPMAQNGFFTGSLPGEM